MKMILTSECERCEYGSINESDKRIKVLCKIKNKEYHYGQCIPCDNMKLKKNGEQKNGNE